MAVCWQGRAAAGGLAGYLTPRGRRAASGVSPGTLRGSSERTLPLHGLAALILQSFRSLPTRSHALRQRYLRRAADIRRTAAGRARRRTQIAQPLAAALACGPRGHTGRVECILRGSVTCFSSYLAPLPSFFWQTLELEKLTSRPRRTRGRAPTRRLGDSAQGCRSAPGGSQGIQVGDQPRRQPQSIPSMAV